MNELLLQLTMNKSMTHGRATVNYSNNIHVEYSKNASLYSNFIRSITYTQAEELLMLRNNPLLNVHI